MNNTPMLVMFVGGDLLNLDNYRCATPEEIKDAHPKCGECTYCATPCGYCYHPSNIDSDDCPKPVTPTTDYCNKWEAK